jgi:NDP-sugar pyrophosphorylase family protein
MDGCTVCAGARVRRAVLDKQVEIGPNSAVSGGRASAGNERYRKCQLDGLSVIGKGVRVPAGIALGAEVVVEAGVEPARFSGDLADGATLAAG